MPFLLWDVTGSSPAAPRMATRCHPQLIFEEKAAQKRNWVEKREKGVGLLQGVGEVGEGPACWGGC